eukprot:scaffold2280_cov430-Prasinococcus_capsulatus_cf.AAC.20
MAYYSAQQESSEPTPGLADATRAQSYPFAAEDGHSQPTSYASSASALLRNDLASLQGQLLSASETLAHWPGVSASKTHPQPEVHHQRQHRHHDPIELPSHASQRILSQSPSRMDFAGEELSTMPPSLTAAQNQQVVIDPQEQLQKMILLNSRHVNQAGHLASEFMEHPSEHERSLPGFNEMSKDYRSTVYSNGDDSWGLIEWQGDAMQIRWTARKIILASVSIFLVRASCLTNLSVRAAVLRCLVYPTALQLFATLSFIRQTLALLSAYSRELASVTSSAVLSELELQRLDLGTVFRNGTLS